jgi:hypothetical protein
MRWNIRPLSQWQDAQGVYIDEKLVCPTTRADTSVATILLPFFYYIATMVIFKFL